MATATMNEYIELVENLYKTSQGSELASLISLRDVHVCNTNLRSSNIAALLEGNCVPPLDEIVTAHLSCVKAITENDFMDAYNQQTLCVAAVVKLLQSQKEKNWSLPLMYAVCLDLRLIAQKADEVLYENSGKLLEKAADSLLACFRICAADNRTPDAHTKRLGMLFLVNQLMKIYFRINKLNLCKPLIRAIDSSPLKSQFSLAQHITYRYFVGRKAMYDSDFHTANDYLSFAFQNCHMNSRKNKRLILTCLIPVKMLLGFMPVQSLLEKYELTEFSELVYAVKTGNLRIFDQVMEDHENFFINAGIYFTVEHLKIIAYRNLFKRVYLLENSHQIDISSFQTALKIAGQESADADETQSIVANLIFNGKIKGYISYQHMKVVVSKQNPFPALSSLY